MQDAIRYELNITADEALGKLADALGERGVTSWWSRMTTSGVAGKVTYDRFQLHWNNARMRNSFRPFLFGKVRDTGGTCVVTADFRMHPFVKAFMFVWFAGLASFGLVFVVAALFGSGEWEPSGAIMPFAFLLSMAGFAVLLVKVGQWLGGKEKKRITEFLEETFEGTIESGPGREFIAPR